MPRSPPLCLPSESRVVASVTERVVAEVDDPAAAETLARACAGEVEVVGAIEHASPIGIRRSDGTFAFVPAPETVLASGIVSSA
jgi:hypothetical protein